MGKTFKEQKEFHDFDYNDKYTKTFLKRKFNKRDWIKEQEKVERKYNDKDTKNKKDNEINSGGSYFQENDW